MKRPANSPNKLSAFLLAAACLACALALFAAGRYSAATIWKDYRILCASPPEREADLLSLLHEAGLRNYATQANSPLLPSQTMATFIPFLSEAESTRSRLFFDSSGEYRVVYIEERGAPRDYAKRLKTLLEDGGFSWILEQSAGVYVFPLALLLALAIFALLFCKPFFAVAIALAFPCLFALTGNGLSSWLSAFFWICCAIEYSAAVFPSRRVVPRAHLKSLSIKAIPFFAPWLLAALVFALASGRGVLPALAVPAGSAAAIVLAAALKPSLFEAESLALFIKERRMTHPAFSPELMLAEKSLAREGRGISPALASFARLLALSAAMIPLAAWLYGRQGAVFFPKRGQKEPAGVYIPAPEMYTSKGGFSAASCEEAFKLGSSLKDDGEGEGGLLFSLSDFAALQWNVFAYPWRKMSEPFSFPHDGSEVKYKDYVETGFGALKMQEVAAARFDSRFIEMLFEKCSSPLEKMLIRQGGFFAIKRRQMPQ